MAFAFNQDSLDRLLDQLAALVRRGNPENREELRSLAGAAISATLSRMNLVTREEFDAQSALLARTREKLDRLEAQLAALEHGDA